MRDILGLFTLALSIAMLILALLNWLLILVAPNIWNVLVVALIAIGQALALTAYTMLRRCR